ncbi:hypothetical protein BGW36DRAFT_374858 [Talaromyces proteolyticus]|uniref:RRM domain-containing protein n=1 Tax=Talaromyces proteolyticus TaxID=1131652 RepID=A0AAD4KWZ2_9EURO|nr:uncharacterized protein BGW36DRAFT_374858 [Talaromyces proteolyticus]KAH8700727.1 hypothetical protein BGW36DRAFT_374858 [Talaromyces proteolyticus]
MNSSTFLLLTTAITKFLSAKQLSMTKLFIGGLASHTTDAILRQGFEKFGEVEAARDAIDAREAMHNNERGDYSPAAVEEGKSNQAPQMYQPQQIFTSGWELPSLLKNVTPSTRKDFIFNAITLLSTQGHVELMTCRRYLERVQPKRGVKLVEIVIDALISSENATPDRLTIITSREDSQINDIAVWLCLTFREPSNISNVMISSGSFDGARFKLNILSNVVSPACWFKLFNNAVIVVMPGESTFPSGWLLELSFGALLQLAAVEYPVVIDSGIVLMGYSTALIPVDINPNGQVIWHLEVASENRQLRRSELQATQGSWLQKQTLEELNTETALLGWCTSAQVRLGSDSLEPNVTWSDAKVKPITWRWKGANLQLLAQSAAPLQLGAQAGFAWERTINAIRFTPGENYLQCLANSMLEHAILCDVSAQRSWLVPLISVYHHMLLVYHHVIFPGDDRHPIPVVAMSDASSSSWDILRVSGSVAVEGSGEDRLTVRELIMGFSVNFAMTSLQPPKGSRIYGYEFMDLVVGSLRSELKAVVVESQGLGWAPLLNEVPCLFCSELGDAIVGTRAGIPDSPCNYLPTGQNLLASSIEAIQMLCRKQGSTLTGVSGRVTRDHVLSLHGQPFIQCPHSPGASSCWDHPEEFIQKIRRGTNVDSGEQDCEECNPPVRGALVFGSTKSQSLNWASKLRR